MSVVENVEPSAEPSAESAASRDRTRHRLVLFVAVIIGLLALRTFVVEPVTVRSDSMAPGIRDGDVLVVDKLTYRFRNPHVGEIVVTIDPRSAEMIVKRVVAVGGDSVGLDAGRLIRNDQIVGDDRVEGNLDGTYFGPVIVPPGHVFVLGDDRELSTDSRAFGTLHVDQIEGRIVGHVWPLGGN
jgi:signal peptidase I